MKQLKIAKIMICLHFAVFIVSNWYFGWNIEAQSETEKTVDNIMYLFLCFTIGFYLFPAFRMYEIIVKKYLP